MQSFYIKDSRCEQNSFKLMTGFRVKVYFSGVQAFFNTPAAWHYTTGFILPPQGGANTGITLRKYLRKADTEMC